MSETMHRKGALLTAREIESLTLVAAGRLTKEVAADLGISKRTVDFHLYNAHKALGARNRIDAITKAKAAGLL